MCWSSQQLICTDHNRGYKCNYHTIAALIDSSFLTLQVTGTISKKHTHTIDCYALAILWKGTVYKQVVFL